LYFAISNALKKRLVQVFQEIVSEHPIFCKTAVVTKFPEEERQKTMLLIRSVSGSSQKLGLDNFIRTDISYSLLANLQTIKGNSIEWVKDDSFNIEQMSAPGIYIIKMIEEKKFVVDPFLTIGEENLVVKYIQSTQGFILRNIPINPGSEVIYAPHDYGEFKRDIDYTIDYNTGLVLFKPSIISDVDLMHIQVNADYQKLGTRLGPFETDFYWANNTAIPGVILAFGDRLKKDDEQAVIIEKEMMETAKVYGGRWELSVDMIGIAQDPDQQERLVDYAVSIFWAKWQNVLVDEGINVSEFSLSGESEDTEMDIPEEYNFTGGINFSLTVDWELAVPLVTKVRYINIDYGEESFKRALENEKEAAYENKQYDSRMQNSGHQMGLIPDMNPVVLNPNYITNLRSK